MYMDPVQKLKSNSSDKVYFLIQFFIDALICFI